MSALPNTADAPSLAEVSDPCDHAGYPHIHAVDRVVSDSLASRHDAWTDLGTLVQADIALAWFRGELPDVADIAAAIDEHAGTRCASCGETQVGKHGDECPECADLNETDDDSHARMHAPGMV